MKGGRKKENKDSGGICFRVSFFFFQVGNGDRDKEWEAREGKKKS